MESRFFEKSTCGRLFNIIGHALFAGGLAATFVLVFWSRHDLARALNNGLQNLWPTALVVIGFVFFLAAKSTVLRQRVLVSFGSGKMPNAWSVIYVLGYGLMIVGCALLFRAL